MNSIQGGVLGTLAGCLVLVAMFMIMGYSRTPGYAEISQVSFTFSESAIRKSGLSRKQLYASPLKGLHTLNALLSVSNRQEHPVTVGDIRVEFSAGDVVTETVLLDVRDVSLAPGTTELFSVSSNEKFSPHQTRKIRATVVAEDGETFATAGWSMRAGRLPEARP